MPVARHSSAKVVLVPGDVGADSGAKTCADYIDESVPVARGSSEFHSSERPTDGAFFGDSGRDACRRLLNQARIPAATPAVASPCGQPGRPQNGQFDALTMNPKNAAQRKSNPIQNNPSMRRMGLGRPGLATGEVVSGTARDSGSCIRACPVPRRSRGRGRAGATSTQSMAHDDPESGEKRFGGERLSLRSCVAMTSPGSHKPLSVVPSEDGLRPGRLDRDALRIAKA